MDNSKIQTLSDFVRYGKTSSFTIPQVSLVMQDERIVFLDEVVYSKYANLLMQRSSVIDLTTVEYNNYRLDPKKLSTELYGTPNLYHLILFLNNVSEFEFDLKRIRLLPYSDVENIFKYILAHEEKNITDSINKCRG